MSKTKLASLELAHPIMNAAGTCKTKEDVLEMVRTAVSAVVWGSITILARTGNSGEVYWNGPHNSLNSLGMPNPGLSYVRDKLCDALTVAHDVGKPIIVSVAGFTPEEYAHLTHEMLLAGADAVELNLGCPNIWQEDKQKRIASFDPDMVEEILSKCEGRVGTLPNVGCKISPFSDPVALGRLAGVLSNSVLVKFVTTTNTFPNAFGYTPNGTPCISPAEGLAGMAGPALKPIALGQVLQLRKVLHERIQIVGVGGICAGDDVVEYERCGASAVQVATAFFEQGGAVFGKMLETFVDFHADDPGWA